MPARQCADPAVHQEAAPEAHRLCRCAHRHTEESRETLQASAHLRNLNISCFQNHFHVSTLMLL